MLGFLVKTVVISLSGVLAPGPVTAATLASGSRKWYAGTLIALGHGVIEFPLMALIILGVGQVFEIQGVRDGIGLAGGGFLGWMGVQMLRDAMRPLAEAQAPSQRHPLVIGILLTAGNPYFLLWWATVGLALATEARTFGIMAFAVFAVLHWLLDLVWLQILSLTGFSGTRLFGDRTQKIILIVCGYALIVFAIRYVLCAGADVYEMYLWARLDSGGR
jgi:threonine/homoserine/homoserine lactone efflux protein